MKKDFLAKEENLNLLDKKIIKELLNNKELDNYEIKGIKLLMFTSNLILIIKKK